MQGNAAPAGGPAITGTISVSLELAGSIPGQAVLFVIAYKGARASFAVQRIVGPRFPQPYRLGPDDLMMAGSPFEAASVESRGRMGEDTADLATLRRILLALKLPESFLRQYPRLAVKLAAVMKRTRGRAPGTWIGSERGNANLVLRREPERAI